MKKYFKLSVFIIILICCILFFLEVFYFDISSDKNESPIIKFHAATIIILTLALTLVAWMELSKLNETSEADFLLRIDRRYGSHEMIKARVIIHRLYCDTRNSELSVEKHRKAIAEKFKEVGQKEKYAEDFMYLVNFLDFLETIAYFEQKNYITKDGIDELIGGSIVYYFHVFKQLIEYRREKYKKPNFYYALENLVNRIESN